MSFAAAICSIVSEGIVPMRARLFLPRLVLEAMPNLCGATVYQAMKILPVILSPSTSLRMTLAAILFMLATTAHAREAIRKGDVAVVPLRGEVEPSLLAFLRRAVKTAESNEASAIIFQMNTYGGRLDTATDIVNALNQTKISTYTFIDPNAGSAGAIIAIATQHVYMAPVSAIGAAAPVLSTGEDLPATAKEK